MIDSEFCIRCGRPYAMYKIWYCDSCIKDMAYEGYKKLKLKFGMPDSSNINIKKLSESDIIKAGVNFIMDTNLGGE